MEIYKIFEVLKFFLKLNISSCLYEQVKYALKYYALIISFYSEIFRNLLPISEVKNF